MAFAEKLKIIRKQAGMSQEQLAEKLGVSRQAVTKWEADAGIPDIGNIMGISNLFGISIDELLSNEKGAKKQKDYLYESITEYDVAERKHFDMKFGGAKKFIISGYDGEKITVRLVSNTFSNLQNDFKVKIDDIRNRIDVDVERKNGMTEAKAKEEVIIFVQIPLHYIRKIECAVNAGAVEINSLECENMEFDIKTPSMVMEDVIGTVEINCNLDMDIQCKTLNGAVELNQISATSRICVPEGVVFTAVKKGVATSISYEKNGEVSEDFSTAESDNVIELNGIKSELVIYTISNKGDK
jgi:transcriptional regulator with XRE-family HTH domain